MKEEIVKALSTLKSKHKVGVEVPVGGSSCSTCEYLSEDGLKCKNKEWIKWNKENNILPFPANRYCCDFYEWD